MSREAPLRLLRQGNPHLGALAPHCLGHLCGYLLPAMSRRQQFGQALAFCLGLVDPEGDGGSPVEGGHHPLGVHGHEGLLHRRGQRSEQLLELRRGIGRPLQVFHVGVAPVPPRDLASGIPGGGGSRGEPAVPPILGPETQRGVKRGAAPHRAPPLLAHPLAVVGVHLLQPAVPQLLHLRDPGVVHPALAQVVAGSVRPAAPDEGRQEIDHLAELARLLSQRALQQLVGGDVGEGDDHAVDHVLQRAVGEDAHGEPAAVARAHLLLLEHQRAQHLTGVLGQLRVLQLGGDVRDRTPGVPRDELDELGGLGGEAPHEQVTVEEEGGEVGGVEEVLHVVAGARQLVHLGQQLLVDGLQLLVHRLHLLLGGGQLLVGGLQLLVGGLQLLVGGLELLL